MPTTRRKRAATLASAPLLLLAVLCATLGAESGPSPRTKKTVVVKAKRKPADAWKPYDTRTLDLLEGFVPRGAEIKTDAYGGWLDRKARATGFFRAENIGDRWWLVDPDGRLFLHVGVCSVRLERSAAVQRALAGKFGSPGKWADATARLLRDSGFNGIGGWSDFETLRKAARPLPYTISSSFMSRFGGSKKLTFSQPGHTGFPNDCIPVFHPEFESFCDNYAKTLAAAKDDPYLIGHFSDNELPASRDLLDKFLALDANNPDLAPNLQAAHEWLVKRKGPAATINDATDEDRSAFVELVYDRYFAITTRAIRKYDPNHLCLGSRLYGWSLQSKEVFRAAGRHLDVIALNYYGAWGPNAERIATWTGESRRPIMVTEFYAKGEDSGMKNTTGAGWLVPTQQDRGRFYQNFVLGLLESRGCVGWHWFKYMDNDPADLTTDPSNRDSNKGIVNVRFEPYSPLLAEMKALNAEVYPLTRYFDAEQPAN